MATPVRAYSYSRFSRFHQGKGDSARRQQRMVDDYCQRHGLLLDDSLNLNDFGVSAFRGRHRQCGPLSQFLEGVRTGIVAKGSHFLVEDVDRLSREPVLDHLELVTDLLKSRITLALLDLGWQLTRDMLNKPGESWRIQALVSMMERAHGESARKSDMIGQVRARERQEEAAGLKKHKRTPPGWIEWDDEAQDYRLHPIHAPTIRRVFELAGEGLAQYQIARRLMEENYAPVYGGTFWNTSYISKLLDDDRVLGVYQPHKLVDGERVPEGEPLQGYYPELVTPEMFARAQAHRVVPNHRGGYSQSYANLFSGFCHCAECGWPMQLKTVHKYEVRAVKNGKTRRVRQKHGYLICKKKITLKTCRAKNFRYDKLEELILNTSHELDLSRVMQDDGVTLKLRQKEDEIAAREKEVSDLKARIEGLIDLLETAKAETRQDFQDRLSKRTAERDRLRGVLTALRREREVLEQERAQQSAGPKSVARLRAELENASGEALYTMRRKLAKAIHSFVDDLRFHADGSVEVVAYGGLVRRSWNLETGSIMLVYDTEFLRSRARAWPTSGSSC